MFNTKCGWCQEEFHPGDECALYDEKLFHLPCLTLYRMYLRDLLQAFYLANPYLNN